MADEFRGLTLRLGADARPLKSALSSIQRSAGQAQKQLRDMSKALKFDGSNTAAMAKSIDLLGDKGILAARAMREVERATSQADESIKKMASSNKSVYSSTQKVKAEYNHVNAELQHVYDAVAKAAKAGEKFKSLEEAVEYVKMLREAMDGTGRNAKTAREEFNKYLEVANKGGKLNKMFGQQKESMDALKGTIEKLKEAHASLNRQHEVAKAAEGYKAAEMASISWKNALMEAADEATKMKARMYALGNGGDLIGLNRRISKTESALEEASKAALKVNAAFSKMPDNVEVATAKVRALREQNELATDKVDQLRRKLEAIEKQKGFSKQAAESSNVYRAFERASESASKAEADFRQAQARVDGLNTELDELRRNLVAVDGKSDNVLDEFNSDAATAKSRVEKLESELEQAVAEMKRLERESESAGNALAVATMNREYRMTQNQLATAQAQADEFRRQFSRSPWIADMAGKIRTMGYGLYSTITPVAAMGMRYAIQAADDVDAAYRNMRKTVNGTEEDFEHLRQAALEFGRTHVTSADQILEIEAIGGQLGIAATNLEKFSEVVSNVDIATNMDTETISENLGQLSNIMKDMDQDLQSGPGSMEAFSDSLVRLGNNSAAQEDKIMNVMMRIASMGTISGMATPDLLALSTAVAAAGQGSEAAGTAVAKTFTQIEAAVGEGSDKLEKYGEIAGMSAQEFADAWGTRPTEAFVAFIEGLKRIDEEGGSVSNTLADLSINGVRQRQTLMNLTNTVDVMNRALVMSNDAWNGMGDVWGDSGDAAREAQRKAEGFSGQLQILKNAAQEVGVSLLDGTVPILQGATAIVQTLSGAVSSMPEPLKRATILLGLFAAAAGPMMVAGGAVLDGFTKIKEVTTSMRSFKLLETALGGGPAFFLNTKRQQSAIAATTDAMKANARQIALVDAAQSRHVVSLGMESRALSERRSALVKQRDELERTSTATKNAATVTGTFKSALRGLAGAAGVMFAVEAIGQLAGAIGEAIEKSKRFEEATAGLKSAAAEVADAANGSGREVESYAAKSEAAAAKTRKWNDVVEKTTQGNIDLAQSIRDGKAEAEASTSTVEAYAKEMMKLNGQHELSSDELKRLKVYVNDFNEATGASVTIIDEQTGALSMNNEQLQTQIDLLKENAKKDYFKKNMEDAARSAGTTRAQIEELKKDLDEARKNDHSHGRNGAVLSMAQDLERLESQLEAQEAVAEKAKKNYEETATAAADAAESMAGNAQVITDEMAEAEEELEAFTDAFEELFTKYPEIEGALESVGIPFDSWGTSAQQFKDELDSLGLSVDDFASGIESMVDQVSNGFTEMTVNEEATLSSYLETLQKNKEVTQSWGDNLKTVYDHVNGITDESAREMAWSWVREMADAGPAYANVVAEMASQGGDAILQEAQAWHEARSVAIDSYLDSVGVTSEAVKAEIQGMVESSKAAIGGLEATAQAAISYRAHVLNTTPGELKAALDSAGVSITNFANMSDEDFAQMAAKAGNDIEGVANLAREKFGETHQMNVEVDQNKVVSQVADARNAAQDLLNSHPVTMTVETRYAPVRLNPGVYTPGRAAGGISPSSIRKNAAGGLNGIITRAMLTNVGWVGEAGDEAIFHMRNAGGAIVPLSNRQHVKPFAQAVAAEMPYSGASDIVAELRALRNSLGEVNLNVTVQSNRWDDPDEIGRRIGNAAALELKMRGVVA